MSSDCGVFSLADKVIIVTGGTRRYGYYFCEALAAAGATVILTSRDKHRADEAAAKVRACGPNVFGYSLDLGDDDSIEQFVTAVIQDHNKIDVLVNNARTVPGMAAGRRGRLAPTSNVAKVCSRQYQDELLQSAKSSWVIVANTRTC